MQLQFSHPSISDSGFVERIEQKKASFYRVAFGYTRNEDDALEVVQEAVCKAYTAKWRLRDPERFYPWFYRTTDQYGAVLPPPAAAAGGCAGGVGRAPG